MAAQLISTPIEPPAEIRAMIDNPALSFTIKGQHATRLGILTFALAKQGEKWKIDSRTWGRLV